jgi:hypothetical protein
VAGPIWSIDGDRLGRKWTMSSTGVGRMPQPVLARAMTRNEAAIKK